MQKTLLIFGLLWIALLLTACNLGAGAVEQATEILVQATDNIIVVTREQPTNSPTGTPVPTQQVVSTTVTCSPRTDWGVYTVVAGDTLSRIAVRGNTAISTLVTANCLADANLISPGQVLYVPNPVVVATPMIVTSTPLPQTDTTCRISMTGQRLSYFDQTYMGVEQILNAGETYLITGHNTWSYRIQLSGGREAWLQKSIPETPAGNCGNVPQVSLAYRIQGVTRTAICYFIPSVASFNTYYDQAQTRSDIAMPGDSYYMIDARANNLYRIVSGDNLAYPAWVPANLGRIEGNCDYVPDYAVATTRNASSSTFSDPNFNFAFEYPSNWQLESFTDAVSGYRLGTSPVLSTYPGAAAWPDDIVDVSFVAITDNRYDTAQAFADFVVADIRANQTRIGVIQDSVLFTTNRGLDTYHFITGGVWANTHHYVFEVDGQIYHLMIQGNQSHAVRIIDSLRAT